MLTHRRAVLVVGAYLATVSGLVWLTPEDVRPIAQVQADFNDPAFQQAPGPGLEHATNCRFNRQDQTERLERNLDLARGRVGLRAGFIHCLSPIVITEGGIR
jgi:hypothetical protein